MMKSNPYHLGNSYAGQRCQKHNKKAQKGRHKTAYGREQDCQTNGNGKIVPGGSIENLLLPPDAFPTTISGFCVNGTTRTDRPFTTIAA
jgi:hypothetical protein